MFVQRLPRWLRRLVASLFHPHSAHSLPPERTAVLSAAPWRDAGAADSGVASWLDDGRRLRPRPSPPAKLDQRWNTRPASTRRPVPTQPQSGRAPASRPATGQPAAEPPRKQPAEAGAHAEAPASPAQPAQTNDTTLAAAPSASSPPPDEQLLYRRLMALKRLVRLGVYNEGFAANSVPEQYLASLGREDDLGADSLD
ncbi:MAG: hypothetical protein ACRDHP_07020 [Ktedonobacterales bacterium]